MKHTIVFDIDGTLCDLIGAILCAWHIHHPDGPTLGRPTHWEARHAYPQLDEAGLDWWANAYQDPFLYSMALPVDGAQTSVHLCRLLGWEVIFRSSRPTWMTAMTRSWLIHHGFLRLGDPAETLACGPDAKESAFYGEGRAHIVLVDDDWATLNRINTRFTIDRKAEFWLVTQPYNDRFVTRTIYAPQGRISRVDTIRDIPIRVKDYWLAEQPERVAVAV